PPAASLANLIPDHDEFRAMQSAAPWVRMCQEDGAVDPEARLALLNAIADLQPYDHLCRGPGGSVGTEAHSLLLPDLRYEPKERPGRTVVMALVHWCDDDGLFQQVKINDRLRLLSDLACPAADQHRPTTVDLIRRIPAGALTPGANRIEILHLAPLHRRVPDR